MSGFPRSLVGRWYKSGHDDRSDGDGSYLQIRGSSRGGRIRHFNAWWGSFSEVQILRWGKYGCQIDWGKYKHPVANLMLSRASPRELLETTARDDFDQKGRCVIWTKEVEPNAGAAPSAGRSRTSTVEVPPLRQHSSSAKHPRSSGSEDDSDDPRQKFARVKEEPETPAAAEPSSLGRADSPVAERTAEGAPPDVPPPTRARHVKEEPQEDAPAVAEPGSPGFTSSGSVARPEPVNEELEDTEEAEEADEVERGRPSKQRRATGRQRRKHHELHELHEMGRFRSPGAEWD